LDVAIGIGRLAGRFAGFLKWAARIVLIGIGSIPEGR
jgi:hypothetical protein